ncbi:hypothetical protein J6590_028494 [Homalodisca vitripennis]|nr:hypothetical protein J6590_028494 [Homalodisca vitripennis]
MTGPLRDFAWRLSSSNWVNVLVIARILCKINTLPRFPLIMELAPTPASPLSQTWLREEVLASLT